MLQINKQDIIKTVVILWFLATTGYVIYDQYTKYVINGMKESFASGYTKSVDDLIAQTEKKDCKPIEVSKDDKKIQLVDVQCLQQPEQAPQTPTVPVKK